MANDFVTCDNNFLTLETLLAALIDLHTATGCYGVRVCESYELGCTEVPQCASYEDFLSLFRRAIAIGADGRPAIRHRWNDYSSDLSVLEPGATCGQENFWENLAKRVFTLDADGNVAISIFDVCDSEQ
jgi:hypothetical protein